MVDETQIETMTIRLFDECEGGDGTEETRVHLTNQREFPPIHIVSGRMKGFPAIRLMATAGVALRPNRVEMKDGSVREVPVELVLAIRDERIDTLAHLAYACALDGGTVRPGIVFKNTVELPGSELKHCFLAEPFMWDDGAVFSRGYTLEGGTERILWLQAVPITDRELEYIVERGVDDFCEAMEREDPDLTDPERTSFL
ncbi:MAG: suppressor of fused domain protein [Rikenella sp.]|nr:suppressor of fused domain protein [Rikenella sp.]